MQENTLPKEESQILMSAHKLQITLARKARYDLSDILSFTLQTYGEVQLTKYRDMINDALIAIAKNPQLGHKIYGVMVYNVGRHKIFYRVENSTIYVLRILHDRMDAVRYLH